MKISTPQFPKAYRKILHNNCNIATVETKKTEMETKPRLDATTGSLSNKYMYI